MGIRINAFTLFVIIGLLGLKFRCNKRIGCAETVYNFEMGIKAYPDHETVNIGDTIWFEINETTILTDIQTGRSIDYSNAGNLSSNLGFSKLNVSVPKWEDAADEFDYIVIEGSEVSPIRPSLQREYKFTERRKNTC